MVFKGNGEADTDLRLLPIVTNTHINRFYNVKITQVLLYNTLLDMIKPKPSCLSNTGLNYSKVIE